MTVNTILDENIFSINQAIKEIVEVQGEEILTKNYHKLLMVESLLMVAVKDLKEVLESERIENHEPQPETIDLVEFAHKLCMRA